MDQISDMLTRIRNAQAAGRMEVVLPSSKLKTAIADVLQKEEFVSSVTTENTPESDKKQQIRIALRYESIATTTRKKPAISTIRRVSKPGQRRYVRHTDIHEVKNGHGIMVVSTSQGVMTGRDARKRGLGGEVVCEVW